LELRVLGRKILRKVRIRTKKIYTKEVKDSNLASGTKTGGRSTAGTSIKVLFIYVVNRTLMFVIICTILYRLMPAVLREPVTAFVKIVTDAVLNLLRIGVKLLQLPFKKKKKKDKEKDED
jgi:hypothetical protein